MLLEIQLHTLQAIRKNRKPKIKEIQFIRTY